MGENISGISEAITVCGKRLSILWNLTEKPLHYMELQRMIPKATPKMLSQQLHDLEKCGMIHREVIPDKPPRTLYSLTPFGRSIIPVLDAMCNWGTNFLDRLDIQPPCCTKNQQENRDRLSCCSFHNFKSGSNEKTPPSDISRGLALIIVNTRSAVSCSPSAKTICHESFPPSG